MTDKTPAETPGLKNEPLNNLETSVFGDAPTTGAMANSLVLSLKEPTTIGSVVIPDAKIKVWVMKPGKKMKAAGEDDIGDVDFGDVGDAGGDEEEDTWIPLPVTGKAGSMGVALAPEGGIKTSALRIGTKRINFTLAMPRRFDEVSYLAERVGTEGNPTPKGGWMVTREGKIIQPTAPVAMAYVWKEEYSLRGMLLFEPTAPPPGRDLSSQLCVDVWTGPDGKDPKESLTDDTNWRQVAVANIGFAASAYPLDFGEVVKTRALRVRLMTSAASKTVDNVNWAGFTSAAILRYLEGDPEGLPQSKHDRVAILKLPGADSEKDMATLERYVLMPKPSQLAFSPNGTLYAVSNGQIATVPLNDGETSRIVVTKDKISNPSGLACDAKGMIYVTDGGAKVIKVFDPANGNLVRTIGKPGGSQTGKWDPSYLVNPLGITVDKLGRVWVADYTYVPKRIQRFAADGKPDKSFLGPTQYGGGGTMDSRDRRYVYYQGMKFVIDWDKKSWELDALLGQDVQRTVYYKNHRYIVGPIFGSEVALITEERNRVAVPMAACGVMSKWTEIINRKDLRDAYGSLDGSKYLFVWFDKNSDGIPQAAEVQIKEIGGGLPSYWTVGEDLTFLSPGLRIRTTGLQADGVPVYDIAKLENLNTLTHGDGARNNRVFGDDKGRTFVVGTRLIDADGKQLWEYYNEFAKHDGFYAAGFGYNRPPGVLNQEHNHIGHIKVKNAQGVEEEYFITNSDAGDWFCYTGDGMLVGCIVGGPSGYGKKYFSMPEWEPGKLDLTDLRPGQEHYQGCVVNTDGNVYAIAGHNHMSIVRVEGLESLQRMQGTFAVSPDDINKTQEWQVQRALLAESRKEPKITRAFYLDEPVVNITGVLDEWPADAFFTINETVIHSLHFTDRMLTSQAAVAFDEDNLYVAYRSKTDGPFRNSTLDAPVVFKGGDAAEISLAFDTKADPRRMSPVAGDMRIVFSLVKGKPSAVLFMPVDPKAPADKNHEYTSPVGKTNMDRVELLTDARVAMGTSTMKGGGTQVLQMWTLEAAIPWKSLGVTAPKPGVRLRGDMGILQADGGGMRTINRLYWAGKSQTVVADLPSEARLTPSLWGDFDLAYPDKTIKFKSENPDEPEL
jgi:DNA-binding beta-propeller fold protein YncE